MKHSRPERASTSPRIDDHRAAEAFLVGRMRPDLVRGHEERLVLYRARANQDLPSARPVTFVNAAGSVITRAPRIARMRNSSGAEVVADGQAERNASAASESDLVARLLRRGLAVLDPADDDVEHVDLAVDALHLAVGADVLEVLPSFS